MAVKVVVQSLLRLRFPMTAVFCGCSRCNENIRSSPVGIGAAIDEVADHDDPAAREIQSWGE